MNAHTDSKIKCLIFTINSQNADSVEIKAIVCLNAQVKLRSSVLNAN